MSTNAIDTYYSMQYQSLLNQTTDNSSSTSTSSSSGSSSLGTRYNSVSSQVQSLLADVPKSGDKLTFQDVKKLGRIERPGHRVNGDRSTRSRGAGWEFVHVCVDDASRVAFARILPDERRESAVAFLVAAVEYYRGLGVPVRRVMTDNGSGYVSKAFGQACAALGLRHIRTRPYTPRTNGKAERFIQTALREWAYATAFDHSTQRASELPRWLHDYNYRRNHMALQGKTPMSRIREPLNNVCRHHS